MSQSPNRPEAEPVEAVDSPSDSSARGVSDDSREPDEDGYALGWAAINKLMRRGLSWSGHERNCAFSNLGDGRFAQTSALTGFDFDDDGRALALVDWDRDGDLDLLLTNRNGPRLRYLENQGDEPGLTIELLGAGSNTHAIGARVEVRLGPDPSSARRLLRAVRAGEGYLAQSSGRLHFGLLETADGEEDSGEESHPVIASVQAVQVTWPNGERESFEGVQGPGEFVLRQGVGRATRRASTAPSVPASSPAHSATSTPENRRASPSSRRIVLASKVPLPRIEMSVHASGGEPATGVSLFGLRPGGEGTGTGRAILVHLWSSTCAPCVVELRRVVPHLEELESRGLAFLAVSVDEGADAAAAIGILQGLAWPRAFGFLSLDSIEVLDALQGVLLDTEEPMALPTSFLVDASGCLRAIYAGPVEHDVLLEDLALTTASGAAQWAAATPFPGIWHARPKLDLAFFEGRLRRRGLERAAAEYERASYQVVQKSRAQMLHEFGRESAAAGQRAAAIETLRQALEEDPDYVPALFDLGQLEHIAGRLHEAISAYLRVLALAPGHEEARFNLALAYAGTRQFRSARRELLTLQEQGSALAVELEGILDALDQEQDS